MMWAHPAATDNFFGQILPEAITQMTVIIHLQDHQISLFAKC